MLLKSSERLNETYKSSFGSKFFYNKKSIIWTSISTSSTWLCFNVLKIRMTILKSFLWYWKVFTAIYFSNLQQIILWNLNKVGFEALRAYVRFDFGNVFVKCSFRFSIWIYLQLKKNCVTYPWQSFYVV